MQQLTEKEITSLLSEPRAILSYRILCFVHDPRSMAQHSNERQPTTPGVANTSRVTGLHFTN